MTYQKTKVLLAMIMLLVSFTVFSCSFLFGYQIEGTKWKGTILFAELIYEFEPGGIVKVGSIELIYNTTLKNQGTYTFDKASLTGTITTNGGTIQFSINEKTETLTASTNGISINLQNVTNTFSWPFAEPSGNDYSGVNEDGYIIYISFTTNSSGTISFTNPYTSESASYNFTSTYNYDTYDGKITFSIYSVDYQISIDEKYCVFDYLSDYPVYCEKVY